MEPLLGHLDRGVGDRGGRPGDGGLGAGPLADLEGVAEQQVQRRAGTALVLGQLPGGTDLAEDLVLAEHGRVEPGGHLEQVGDRGVVVLAVEVRVEIVGVQPAELAEEVADVAVGAVEPLGDGVDLGAVAGGEHHDLADVLAGTQRWTTLASVSALSATRSSTSIGLVRWLTPMTTIDMVGPTRSPSRRRRSARCSGRRRGVAARSS